MIGVETLIALASQLIGLIKARKEYKDDEFSTFVEPLFIETEKIIGDYLQLFQNTLESVRHRQDYLQAIFDVWVQPDPRIDAGIEEALKMGRRPYDDSQSMTDFKTSMRISAEYDKHRQKLLPARIKIMEMAEVYAASDLNDDIKKFAASIVNVFNVTDTSIDFSPPFRRSVYVSQKLGDENVPNWMMINFLEDTVNEIRENWEIVSNQYAQLRIQSRRLR